MASRPYFLFVDGIPHQQMVDSADRGPRAASIARPTRGSRTGPSTASSSSAPAPARTPRSRWRTGAKHVDAVEIDPKLAQIGRDFHPEGVYDDPRVTVHVNDGRAFLQRVAMSSTTSSSTP